MLDMSAFIINYSYLVKALSVRHEVIPSPNVAMRQYGSTSHM